MTTKYVAAVKKGNTTAYTSLEKGDIRKHAEKLAIDLSWKRDAGEIDSYYIFRCENGRKSGINEYDSGYHWVREGNACILKDENGNELKRYIA